MTLSLNDPKATPSFEEQQLQITGMTCASCVGRVEKALAKVPDVYTVAVNLATEQARIEADAGVSLAALEQAITAAGAAMAFSSVSVVSNALLLRRWRPQTTPLTQAK